MSLATSSCTSLFELYRKEEADVIMADVVIMEYLVLQQANGKTLRFLVKIAKVSFCFTFGVWVICIDGFLCRY